METLLKYRSVIALIVMYTGILFEQYWVFGVLLLVWVVQDLFKKQTYMLILIVCSL